MGTAIRALIAIVLLILAFKILKGILGLAVGIAIAAVIFFGAQKLLEKK
jgi:hypothetical protein